LGAEQAPASEGQAPDELPPELLLLETPPLVLLPPTVVVPLDEPLLPTVTVPLLELPFPDPPDPEDELDPMTMVQVEPPDELPDELEDDPAPQLQPLDDPPAEPPSQSIGLVQAFASMSHTCPLGQSQSQLQYDGPSSKQNEPAQPDAEPPASTP
jgi:hypothetical protein